MIGFIAAARAPRDWVADPPRFRTFAVYGHAGAWAYPLPRRFTRYARFRIVLVFRRALTGEGA